MNQNAASMPTPSVAIKVQGLTKKFAAVTAVDNLCLEINEGEIFGLVGPDGAGKTTTMRLLVGIMDPLQGEVWIQGYRVGKDMKKINAMLAYMPQRFGLYEDLTVSENIDFYADMFNTSQEERKKKIPRLLEFTKLGPFQKRLAGNLSGGMKQKLGLACALIHTPKVLFLDEPTNGVDPVARRDFWNILYELLKEKVTIVYSTAYLDEAERCKRIGLLHKGKLLRCDAPEVIKQERNVQTLEQAFISIIKEQEQ